MNHTSYIKHRVRHNDSSSLGKIYNFSEYGEKKLNSVLKQKQLKQHYQKYKTNFRDLLVS
jgi:predicted nucleotidyltransferase